MPALFQNVCYPDVESAHKQECSKYAGATTNSDGTVFTSRCISTDWSSNEMKICQYKNGSNYDCFALEYSNTPDCDHDGGVTLAYDYFLVALTFLIIVYGSKKLLQLFDNHHTDN